MNALVLRLVTHSPEETQEVGRVLGCAITSGDLLALTGDLGSGKTCLVQGIARGMGVPASEYVRSPTFVLLNVYQGRRPLFHMDCYRMGHPDELEDLGYRDIFFGQGVVAVEWADRARAFLPADCLDVGLRFLDETRREMVLQSAGVRFEGRLESWAAVLEPFRHPPARCEELR